MKKIILIILTLIIGQVNAQNLPLTFEGGQAPGFGDFNGSVTQVISNPDATGINTSGNVAQNTVPGGAAFAGVSIGVPVDLTTDKYFKMQVWSSIPNTPVLLKLEGGPAPVQREVTTTTTGAWEELVFDFSSEGALVYTTAVIFMNFNVVDANQQIYYWDNLELYTPPFPINFEGGQAPGFGDFNGSVTQIISNPDATGINTSGNVAQNTVPGGAAFAGVSIGVPVDLTTDKYFKMQVWSSIPNTPVLLKLEGGPAPVQREATTTTTGAWEELVFDFSSEGALVYTTAVIFMNFNVVDANQQIYYWDNLDLYTPPPPTGTPLPITFETGDDPNFQDFNGSDTQIITNPYQEGINTSENVAQNIVPANESFAGVSFSVQTIDISQGKTFNLDVRTLLPNAPILLKLENTANATSIEREIIISDPNEWENITFDFSAEADATYDKVTLFMYFNFPSTINRVAYWDNLEQNLNPLIELPVDFELGAAAYDYLGFEGADSAVESNPDASGDNTSATVMRTTKTVDALFYAGTALNLDVAIDFSSSNVLTLKTWSPKADIPVRLALENQSTGNQIFVDVNTTTINSWETLSFDFAGLIDANVDYNKVVVFFEFIVDLPGDGSTYYFDDIELGTPAEELVELPVDFELGAAAYDYLGFEGADSAVESNPDASGDNTSATVMRTTKTVDALFYAGTALNLDVAIDFSSSNVLTLKTWSPKADIPVRLALENQSTGNQIFVDVNTTTINSWETLSFDFAGLIDANVDYNKVVVFFEFIVDLPGDGSTYYFDDIELGTPAEELVELPVDFELGAAAYDYLGFEGADSAVESNPDASGDNTSATVMRTTKTVDALFYAGTALNLDVAIDFSSSNVLTLKTWSPKADIPVRLALENQSTGNQIFVDVNTTTINSWETLSFDFAGLIDANVDYNKVVVFFEFIVDLPGDGSTYYYDDIELGESSSELNAPITFEPGEFGNTWTWTVFENDDNPPLEIIANPDASGVNTSATVAKFTARDEGQPFAGVESLHGADLGVFDLTSETSTVTIMVWKTKISDVGIKFATPSGGAQPEIKVANTLINQWEEITFDFSGYIGLPETTGLDQIIIFPDFIDREADDIIYFDNITIGSSVSVPIELPVDFELGAAAYDYLGFEGADSAVESNPDASGDNTSATVMRTTKTVDALFYAGTALNLDVAIDFSSSNVLTLKTWSPKADIPVRLALENQSTGNQIFVDVNTTTINSWETLSFDFAGLIDANVDYNKVVVFFEFIVDLPGDGSTYYYDDIELGESSSELNAPITFEPGEFGNTWTWTVFENDDNPPLEIIANPDASGVNTSATVAKFTARDEGQPFAGVESLHGADLGVFDLTSETSTVTIMVWKTKISDVGIKFATPSGGAQPEIKVANTLINQWEEITFDFSGYIGLPETTGLDQIIIFPDFIDREADDIIYFDNITIGSSVSVPIELPVDFELGAAAYDYLGFEGADSAVESNPDASGDNTSATVMRTTKTVDALFYAGTALNLDVAIDFSSSNVLTLKTWSPKADIPVRLALENQSTGNEIFVDVNTTTINSWETLSFDFAGLIDANVDYNKVVVFFEFIVDLPGDGSTYYYDDIELAEPLGVNENELQTVIYYPNPTNNIWNIETNNQVIESIQVVDIQGKVVLNIYPNSSKAIINASSLTTGMYLTRINTSEGIKIIKLIKY